ncbi:MAG: OmpA family protein [Phycisphaerales bacterium]|nr:OmpA family protein [Phycisphaerales bacterium]
MEGFFTFKRVLTAGILAAGLALSMGMGGCSNNKQAAADAEQESAELRQKNAQLEQSLRERDTTIAELQKQQIQQQQVQPAPSNELSSSGAPRNSRGSGDFGSDVGVDQTREGTRLTVSGDLLFNAGQATLKDSAKKTLDKVASELKSSRYSKYSVRVEGYTDTDPIRKSKWASNEALSEARARSVEKYLASKGVSSSRVSAVGRGAANPKSSKAASRRVEIYILDR